MINDSEDTWGFNLKQDLIMPCSTIKSQLDDECANTGMLDTVTADSH